MDSLPPRYHTFMLFSYYIDAAGRRQGTHVRFHIKKQPLLNGNHRNISFIQKILQ
jgi:hypothetical protein